MRPSASIFTMLAATVLIVPPCLHSQEAVQPAAPKMSQEQIAQFLESAKILNEHAAKKGVTGSQRATLSDGTLTHDAHIQTIDEAKAAFQTDRGTELNFKDTYKFNIAAYRLSLLLGIQDMIPVSVFRKVGGKSAAVTWWVDDVKMDELTRVKQHVEAPNPDKWNEQMYVVRVFDQLIYNTDRNLGNLLITSQWRLWMIDHTRAFRLMKTLREPKNLANIKCDRGLLAKMRTLDEATLDKELLPLLTKSEVKGILSRRDKIVAFFDEEIKGKGESAVLYDRPRFEAVTQAAN